MREPKIVFYKRPPAYVPLFCAFSTSCYNHFMKSRPQIQRQLVLFKPEDYLGSLKQVQEHVWVVQKEKMVYKKIKYFPALFKLFDDILVNAAQQMLQISYNGNHQGNTTNTTFITITVKDTGYISILNDGKTIPLEEIGQNKYLVHAIFGDYKAKNDYHKLGYSVKIVNIFSKVFTVETGDCSKKIAARVQWKNNMEVQEDFSQLAYQNKRNYVKIYYQLDMQKILGKNKKITPNLMALMQRRAYDIAGLFRVKVRFNKKQIVFKNFTEYAKLFVKQESHIFFDKFDKEQTCPPRWNVILAKSQHGYQHMSFVNGCIWTKKGGTHVNSVISQIAKKALQIQNKKLRDPSRVLKKPERFQSSYMLFINVFIDEPQFEQVSDKVIYKDTLISPEHKFQSLYLMSDDALSFLEQYKLLQNYKQMANQRQKRKANQQTKIQNNKSRITFSRLDDALNAGLGIKDSCTLIIVQNQAYKNLFKASFNIKSKDFIGYYSLKSKLPNVRDMSAKQVNDNQDFQGIMKALGLNVENGSQTAQNLRYSCVVMVTDNDFEGSLTKGLLINFFQSFWPSILKKYGFIKFLMIPRIKCVNQNGLAKEFLTEEELKQFSLKHDIKTDWTVTNYPSLGNMNVQQFKQLMQNYKKLAYTMIYSNRDEECLNILFKKKQSERRRKWIQQYRPSSQIVYHYENTEFTLRDFVDKELVKYYFQENQRLLPNCYDGLLPIQRKILLHLFKYGVGKQIKLSQLIGMFLKDSNCNYSENYIQNSIISMGQMFIGGNNLNLIIPYGLFGTRLCLGKDNTPAKYLATSLSQLTTQLFMEDDLNILDYNYQTDSLSQPFCLLPILPLILINGCNQTTSTCNSTVFGHKVSDVIDLMRAKIQRLNKSINPGWQRFKGSIELKKKGSYLTKGCYQVKDKRTIVVTQIPPNKSIKQYKSFLQNCLPGQNEEMLTNFTQTYSGNNLLFVLSFQDGKMPIQSEIQKVLKLTACLTQNNMTLMNHQGCIKRYDSIAEIVDEFYQIRLKGYQRRKEYIISKKIAAIEQLTEKIRFIKEVLSGQFSLGENYQTWEVKMTKKNYKKYQDFPRIKTTLRSSEHKKDYKDYEYLYKINIQNLNEVYLRQLKMQKQQTEQSLAWIKKTDEKQLWLMDISKFEQSWKVFNKKKDDQDVYQFKRLDFNKLNQVSLKKRNRQADLSISLDSQQRAELQQKTQQMDDDYQRQHKQQKVSMANPNKMLPFKNQTNKQYQKYDRQKFGLMIAQMQKKNDEFHKKIQQEANGRDNRQNKEINAPPPIINRQYEKRKEREKEREYEKDKLKEKQRQKDRKQQEKRRKVEEIRKNEIRDRENRENHKKQAMLKREALGRHAQQIGRKVQQDMRQQREQQERSNNSERNHLPKPKGETPKMTVPYEYNHFSVNQVQRKRFSSKGMKFDNNEIRELEQNIKRNEQKQRRKKTQCIQINDDD